MQYDYECTDCGVVVTKQRKLADIHKDVECPACTGDCIKVILRAPTVSLEAISGDFFGAARKWDQHREQKMKKEKHNMKEHGEGL